MGDRYALVGNPVAHSKSPVIHAAFARATSQDVEYGLIEAPLDGFAATVERFRAGGGRGLNVTLPFKQEAFRLCSGVSARARVAQAVNTLVLETGFGDNTDGIGLVHDLSRNLNYKFSNVLLLGAGGAAQGVVGALAACPHARNRVGGRGGLRTLPALPRLRVPRLRQRQPRSLPRDAAAHPATQRRSVSDALRSEHRRARVREFAAGRVLRGRHRLPAAPARPRAPRRARPRSSS